MIVASGNEGERPAFEVKQKRGLFLYKGITRIECTLTLTASFKTFQIVASGNERKRPAFEVTQRPREAFPETKTLQESNVH